MIGSLLQAGMLTLTLWTASLPAWAQTPPPEFRPLRSGEREIHRADGARTRLRRQGAAQALR